MKNILLVFSILTGYSGFAQLPTDRLIRQEDVTHIETVLSADDMQGRQVHTPGIEKAAAFISEAFRTAGLKPLPGYSDYRQPFTMVDAEVLEAQAKLDDQLLDASHIIVFSAEQELSITPESHYRKLVVKKGDNFREVFMRFMDAESNAVIFVDSSFAKTFQRYGRFHMPSFGAAGNRIFVLTATDPAEFHIHIKQKTTTRSLTNIAGMIPGKSQRQEYVIFSAHYDHLGVGEKDERGDSVYNGANDDASGTTAVIALAKYFSQRPPPERSLVFATFTAEEIGEFGSAYFSRKMDPDKVMAMFNIEMIGTESKWGKNSAYITGFNKTDMGAILQRNLKNSKFSFRPDPYPDQQLFLRSDNATLAKRGVPAHTISTSKMDSEPYYHTQGDEIKTLDMANMTEIIRAIALSASSIISGKDTPQRVKH